MVGARLSDTSCDKTIAESREEGEREREGEKRVYWCLECKYASIHSIQSLFCRRDLSVACVPMGVCVCMRAGSRAVCVCVSDRKLQHGSWPWEGGQLRRNRQSMQHVAL